MYSLRIDKKLINRAKKEAKKEWKARAYKKQGQ